MLKWRFSKILAPDDLFHNIFQVILSHFYTHMKQQQQQQQQQKKKIENYFLMEVKNALV